jgi:hypothetical protein
MTRTGTAVSCGGGLHSNISRLGNVQLVSVSVGLSLSPPPDYLFPLQKIDTTCTVVLSRKPPCGFVAFLLLHAMRVCFPFQ